MRMWLRGGAGVCVCRADELLDDLHMYDPAAAAWTDLSAALNGTPPSPRYGHGFAAAGGKLYVHGGAGQLEAGERPRPLPDPALSARRRRRGR